MNIIRKCESDFMWEDIEMYEISNFPWDKTGYKPTTKFKLAVIEEGLKLKFIGTEKKVVIQNLETHSRVYQDSCVEFFFNPDSKNSNDYINLEINAFGTILAQIGPDAIKRDFLTQEDINLLDVKTDVTTKNISEFDGFKPWSVEYIIPFELIKKYFPKFTVKDFEILKCNFYKCGDKTQVAHYGCYFNINYHKPSFHRPEFFGDFLIK